MFTLNCRGKLIVIEKPAVMGIINTTPDSFFSESRAQNHTNILGHAKKMIDEGVDIIDIGGQSTRPGSKRITADEELLRVIPAIEIILKKFPDTLISIDTYYSTVAAASVAAGAGMVNDISAGSLDSAMLSTVAVLNVPYVCMHMKGTPESMQHEPPYENVIKEVLDFFIEKTAACKAAGINDVIIDPGFGFGKTSTNNFRLLKNLGVFKLLDKPVLVGISRKSTIYKTLNIVAEDALNGTTVLHTLALQNGANILRVHDVKEAKEAIVLYQKYIDA
ncbi:MAG: dihydropteroate synthase [Ginsengibacter sp.]